MKDSTMEALLRYRDQGLIPGSFVQAVLANDLGDTLRRADSENLRDLVEIYKFIYNEFPSNSWGSRDLINKWIETKNSTFAVVNACKLHTTEYKGETNGEEI